MSNPNHSGNVTTGSPSPAHEAGTILERCPFHPHEGNLTEVVGEWFSNRRIAFWAVFCEACSAHGPEEETKEEAIVASSFPISLNDDREYQKQEIRKSGRSK